MKSPNRKRLLLVLILILNSAVLSQSTWNLLPALTGSLNSLYFVNNQTGWVVGSPGVFKTTNGGFNWAIQSSDSARGVCFINGNTGIIGGHNPKRTTDGGAIWTNLSRFADTLVYDISRTDSMILFACGGRPGTSYGVIWRSIDAGLNWSRVYHYSNAGNYLSVQFINYNTGWATTHTGGIYRTTNGGMGSYMSWSPNIAFYDVFFVDNNTGWLASNSATVRKTTSGGLSGWTQQPLPYDNGFAMHFFNSSDGRVVGPNGIMRTLNGGTNWFLEPSPTSESLNGIFFTGNDTGYICGNNGTILKTVNGGSITNIQNVSSEIPGDYSLSQNYPNPFNPVTKIKFDIPTPSFVKLIVYDVQGQEISTLLSKELNAGTYSIDFDGSSLSSGVYFYKITSGNYSVIKKMVLIK